MSGARGDVRSFAPASQGSPATPSPLGFDEIRDRIVNRCDSMAALDRMCPEAITASAEALTVLHGAMAGRAAELSGQRTPKYFREMVLGDAPMCTEDWARLLTQAPEMSVPAIAVLLRLAGHRVERLPRAAGEILRASAEAERSQAAIGSKTLDYLADDGDINPAEARELVRLAQADVDASTARLVALQHRAAEDRR